MATLVSVEAYSGTLRRYETAPGLARLTHQCTIGKPCSFTKSVVEEFRLRPDAHFSVDPPPRPTGPPASVGTATMPRAA